MARWTNEAVEIRDPLTFGLLSTLLQPTKSTSQSTGMLAYSLDGRSLACLTGTTIIVWDIQTGGVAREIQCDEPHGVPLVWSLDGRTIGVMHSSQGIDIWSICRYDVTSGTPLSSITLQSQDTPHIWAHSETFCVLTTMWGEAACIINTFEVGSTLTKIGSFTIQFREHGYRMQSFSPTTYRVSISSCDNTHQLLLLDFRNLECLLAEKKNFEHHCFSSDASFFAASMWGDVHIWRYNGLHYMPWRQFPYPVGASFHFSLSPTSSSILGHSLGFLKLWHLDGPPIRSIHDFQLGIFYQSNTYTVTAKGSTITITNLLSVTLPQILDTGFKVLRMGLTSNVLLVEGPKVVVAWLLTEQGLVNNVFGDRQAGHGDSIWTVSKPPQGSWTVSKQPWSSLDLLVEGDTGVVLLDGIKVHAYNTRTGEVLKPPHEYSRLNACLHPLVGGIVDYDHPYNHSMYGAPPGGDQGPSLAAFKKGWMEDHGRHLLWLPVEWRVTDWDRAEWFSEISTMQFNHQSYPPTIIRLY